MQELFFYEKCLFKRWQSIGALRVRPAAFIVLCTTCCFLLLEPLPFLFLSQIPLSDFLRFKSNSIYLLKHAFTFLPSKNHLMLCSYMLIDISHCICHVILKFAYGFIFTKDCKLLKIKNYSFIHPPCLVCLTNFCQSDHIWTSNLSVWHRCPGIGKWYATEFFIGNKSLTD